MKKILFWVIFAVSILINTIYFNYWYKQKIHNDEFSSIYKIKNTSYGEGLREFKEKLNNKTPYHLIHVWDTFLLDPTKSVPYFLQIDSFLRSNSSKTVDCVLMSSMREETITDYFKSRGIKFTNLILMNDMDNFVSGICNKKNEKNKIHSVNLLINDQGDLLYYNDKINTSLNHDTLLLKTINSLN